MSPMDEQQRKAFKETFNTVSTGYDGNALRFFPESAEHLAAILSLHGDEQVLDVATGTGHAAMALAGRLPHGRVIAVDFSPGMLEQAHRKAASLNIRNIEFIERDMQDLGFPGGHFDAAVCSFGIFFAEDMDSQLAHIAATVRSKGQVAISSFQECYFGPLKDLMVKRLSSYGAQMPPQTWKRIANVTDCRTLSHRWGSGISGWKQKTSDIFSKMHMPGGTSSGTPGSAGWWTSSRYLSRNGSGGNISRRSPRSRRRRGSGWTLACCSPSA
jgi:ubiquinone/menaquinone biosynthesis C-methylase UbiE